MANGVLKYPERKCVCKSASLDKSRTRVRDVLEIIYFTSCHTWLFFNKYAHENTCSVSWVHEATLRS